MRKVLYIMGQLTDEDVAWMGASGQRADLAAGAVLVREGVALEAVSILLSGSAAVSVAGQQIAMLGPGDIVGEMSLIDRRPPSATVTMTAAGSLLALRKSVLEAKLAADIPFAARYYRALAVFLSERMRATVARLGFGQSTELSDAEEIDPEVLDSVHLAGLRFLMILERQFQVAAP